jgi:hypothetical protein
MGRFVTLTKDLPPEVRGAHPICVLKKLVQEGIDPRTATLEQRERAARACIEEGKLHGIYKLVRGIAKK